MHKDLLRFLKGWLLRSRAGQGNGRERPLPVNSTAGAPPFELLYEELNALSVPRRKQAHSPGKALFFLNRKQARRQPA
jgi:hypothetical protein